MDFSRKLLRKAVAVISAVRGFQKAGASRALRSPPQSPESSPEMSPDYDGTIIEVDDANFKKVVLDGRRDVLIEFYTDWCEDQTAIEQELRRLRQTHKEQTLTVAKCNLDQLNRHVHVYHVPTIKLYPASKKNCPVEYFDDRIAVEGYERFIAEEGTFQLETS